MPMDPQSLYIQLGQLSQSFPMLAKQALIDPSEHAWLARLHALILESGDKEEAQALLSAINSLEENFANFTEDKYINLLISESKIRGIFYRAIALAELRAPDAAQGAFILAGNVLDAMTSIGKLLTSAKQDVLIVDPYMDEKALTDFAILTPAGINIRLLADCKYVKGSLKPAAQRWATQHGPSRPLEVRVASGGSLHDRLIIVDNAIVWLLTQSLNGFATRAPASIARSGDDPAALKVDAYRDMWANATPI